MSNTTTTTGLSAAELAKCRENLKRQWSNRKVDAELLKRAWKDAHRVAAVLYEKYSASKVAVFGSLAERVCFNEHSDIDIVVWGLSCNKDLDASYEVNELNLKRKIELIDFNHAKGLLRERITTQSVHIKRKDTHHQKTEYEVCPTTSMEQDYSYEAYKEIIIQRITDELHAIQQNTESITTALTEIEKVRSECRQCIVRSITYDLIKIYSGIEKIFLRIAREVDQYQPPGSEYPKGPNPLGADWAYDLISQMIENRATRPAVISLDISESLKCFLEFCDYINDVDKHNLDFESVEKHAIQVSRLFNNVSDDLDRFIAYLSSA